jgi:hypothetical protein
MYLKKNELKNYINTTNEGTKENPKITLLPWNYKLPLYLGYQIKWDYDGYFKQEYSPVYKQWREYEITAKFKKSHDRFDCFWGYNNWDFLMGELLPKMENDGLLDETIREFVLMFDKWSVIVECMRVINKHVPDIDYPFVNVTKRVDNFNTDKIY